MVPSLLSLLLDTSATAYSHVGSHITVISLTSASVPASVFTTVLSFGVGEEKCRASVASP